MAKEIIFNELSGIMNWALEGRKRLVKNGKFADPPVMNVTLEEYKKMGQKKKKTNLILPPFCS